MDANMFLWLGLAAGIITSIGFLPQIIKGYATKHLQDVSYWMPGVIAVGMALWLTYGFLRGDIAIIAANAFGVGCNSLLILMKKWYARPQGKLS
jgi:MtN3 and saliva related transmembrane protein